VVASGGSQDTATVNPGPSGKNSGAKRADTLGDTSERRVRKFLLDEMHASHYGETGIAQKPELRLGQPFPFVIAIVPAFNEEEQIQKTIDGLRMQTRRADEIIVVADNCTDSTVEIAQAAGVSVVETKGNKSGKAGALNGLLSSMLHLLDEHDCILVMDADTVLNPKFIEATTRMLFTPSKKPIAGVGGIFTADDAPWSLARQLQDNEYTRYQRRLSRRHGRALVLTGTGTLFTVGVLRQVIASRKSGVLPDLGKAQSVYDVSSLTEDNELTISVKCLGYRVVSPKDCTVKTAMMPTFTSLFKQRIRWQRGALENLISHGINRHTAPYALRQVLTYLGVFFFPFYFYTLAVALIEGSQINFLNPFWVTVEFVYLFEQTFSVRKAGWKGVLVSLLVAPEMLFDVFLDVVYVFSFAGALFATDEVWGRMRGLSRTSLSLARSGLSSIRRTKEDLHGTHRIRQGILSRFAEVAVFSLWVSVLILGLAAPFLSLQICWQIISVYVVVGFAATLGRLVPVRTF
jgi:biofilm PGA synthesis N-glycosyltransferase PgaC